MRRREKIKFKIGTESIRGIIGLFVSALVLFRTVLLIVVSAQNAGNVSIYYAVIALITNTLAIIGFIIALRALMYVRDVRPVIPIIALVLNGITILFYLFIYIVGL